MIHLVPYNPLSIIENLREELKKIRIDKHKAIIELTDIADVYSFGKKIGSGAFGKVYLATHKNTGIIRAVKVIRKKFLD